MLHYTDGSKCLLETSFQRNTTQLTLLHSHTFITFIFSISGARRETFVAVVENKVLLFVAKRGNFHPIMKLLLLCYHVETGNKASIVCKESLNETEFNFEDCSIYIAQKFKRGASSLSVTVLDLMLKDKQSAFVQRRRFVFPVIAGIT